MTTYEELYARFTEAKNFKDRWLALYKNLYFYVIPDRDAFNVKFDYRDDGKPTTQQIWDSTAMLAAYQRANDLHGLLMPKDRVWGKLQLDPHLFPPNVIRNFGSMMDDVNDRIFFYLNESNLSRVVGSSNLDLVGGTGVIWVESQSDNVPLYFRSIPAVATYIEYSTDDMVNTCWFSSKKTGREVLKEFPDYAGTMLRTLKDAPNETYTVNYGQIMHDSNNFFMYAVLENDPFVPLWEANRSYQQIIIYRDRVRPGEAEGRGIALDMMPTIIDLNRITEYSRKSMQWKAYPTMFYDAGTYFNPFVVRQWAGAMIARNPQGRNPLEAMEVPSSPEVFLQIQHLQEMIMKGFQVDPLGEINSPVKTATEISVRENRAQRTSATDISRLINELPRQIYEVASKILNQRGLLLGNKQPVEGFNPKKLRFHFQSPLYDIQNKQDINNFVENLQIKQQFFGQGAAMMSTDLIEANNFLTEKFNLPHKLFANDETLKKALRIAGETQAAALPTPSTQASQVNLPQEQGVTI